MARMIYAAYPRELEAAGANEFLGRLKGEIGIDAVNLAAAHPPLRVWTPRAATHHHTICSSGGAQFIPDAARYTGGRLRPHAGAWLKGRDAFGRIVESARDQGLGVEIRATCLNDPGLVERYPHGACVSVFGDAHDARLCPSNPEVRQYLLGLVGDLARFGPESVELDDVGFGSGFGPQWYSTDWLDRQSPEAALLRWCFCASCLQRAKDSGVNGGAVRESVMSRLSLAADSEADSTQTPGDLLGADGTLAGFETVRRATVASLIRELAGGCAAPLWLTAVGMDPSSTLEETINEAVAGIVVPFSSGHVAAAYEAIARAVPPDRIRASLRIRPPAVRSGSALVAEVHKIAGEGFAAVQFEEDGGSPAHCLGWLRQAIRYARRESGDPPVSEQ
jgi:hypothetical protein